MRPLLTLMLTLAALSSADALRATTMHKCVIQGSVTYQQAPCPSAQTRRDPTLDELNAAEQKRRATSSTGKSSSALTQRKAADEPPREAQPAAHAHRCDGRTHCSQMTSCAEARFFLNHCPGVKMDGDQDGIPCEDQLCGH